MKTHRYLILIAIVIALMLVACGGGDEPAEEQITSSGDVVAGEKLFQGTCSACHGPDAKGLPNLGKDLTASEFFHNRTDEELLAFIKVGRPVDDPANTTGVAMLPKGGNPALTDENLLDIIAFVRTLKSY